MMIMIWTWILNNPQLTALILLGLAETITRLTPTRKDDGFIMRVGRVVSWFFDNARIPNRIKTDI
jgi:hypothetical protein